jgi:hypothetical protein
MHAALEDILRQQEVLGGGELRSVDEASAHRPNIVVRNCHPIGTELAPNGSTRLAIEQNGAGRSMR